MKDLFVLTADSDAQAIIGAILRRHRTLHIRPITFEIERHTGRDSGMVKDGPEIARVKVQKTEYSRLVLAWDHDGSGWHSRPPEDAALRIQTRLNGVTWADRSATVVLVPELEEWIWHCRESLAELMGLTLADFEELAARLAGKRNRPLDTCCRESPKELFGDIFYYRHRRQPLPEDFESIGKAADLAAWRGSQTFTRFADTLLQWFPA